MKFKMKRMAEDGQINGTAEVHLWGILLTGGSANSSVEITEDGDGSGTTVLLVKALTGTTVWVDLSQMGGVKLTQGYADLTGAAAEVVLFWE
jgi:hypothetical protein